MDRLLAIFFKPPFVALALPFISLYLITFVRYFVSAREGEFPLRLADRLPRGEELTLVAVNLDIFSLAFRLLRASDVTRSTTTLVISMITLLLHVQILFVVLLLRRRDPGVRFRPSLTSFCLGVLSLFTNGFTVLALLGEF